VKVREAIALPKGTRLVTTAGASVTYEGYSYSPPMRCGPDTVHLEVRREDGTLSYGLRPKDVMIPLVTREE
jgi:hypothetical protein